VVQNSKSFGLDLFKQINSNSDASNLFISPLSVSMALDMTLNGAQNDTKSGMKEALRQSDLSLDAINKSNQSLIKLLTHLDPKVNIKLANSIWYKNNFTVEQDFIDVNQSYYDAEVQGLDFSSADAANQINNWVSDKTESLIDEIIKGRIPSDIVMYLINAIYFKANWWSKFDEDDTRKAPFTTDTGSRVDVDMMSQQQTFPLYVGSDASMIDLPYGDSLFTMSVILPPTDTKIDTFVNHLTSEKLDTWFQQLSAHKTNLYLPRFKIKYQHLLNDVLARMGMGKAFEPYAADFSGINQDQQLFISKVLHKSYIKVDEAGTEAAAVTAVGVALTGVDPNQPYTFRVDRPFVYLIRERTTNTILFMGKMGNPNPTS